MCECECTQVKHVFIYCMCVRAMPLYDMNYSKHDMMDGEVKSPHLRLFFLHVDQGWICGPESHFSSGVVRATHAMS